ncbi:MAG: hypothetical protein H7337_22135 [Rhizobacter sp.]|nr:hypothetical protein [Rhizobacter sp.]
MSAKNLIKDRGGDSAFHASHELISTWKFNPQPTVDLAGGERLFGHPLTGELDQWVEKLKTLRRRSRQL